MKRQKQVFQLSQDEYKSVKARMLNWSQQFGILLFLDNNEYPSLHSRFECLLAVDPTGSVELGSFNDVNEWFDRNHDWLFGHISYDFKNLIEPHLKSSHPIRLGFPVMSFFCPAVVCYISKDRRELTIEATGRSPRRIFEEIASFEDSSATVLPPINFSRRMDKAEYLSRIGQIQRHIRDGDCYEINFCSESYAEGTDINPFDVFKKLNSLSPAPFAACYRLDERYMMCASPERYLMREVQSVISQPIKGTARRYEDENLDYLSASALRSSIKERAENVMIVDLVRNDLARSCRVASVKVEELFGIYSFPQVHQLISTVRGEVDNDAAVTDAIKHSFPMGSMTGAPKIKVMELIDRYEESRRELFSGTVGYITPDKGFDFNVIIRSLFYHSGSKYLSYQTGGAITADSDPNQEWEEIRLKAWALEKIFAS